ncbi:hypothetical protein Droror1_Dr00009456 [Drosera rotundifolia]
MWKIPSVEIPYNDLMPGSVSFSLFSHQKLRDHAIPFALAYSTDLSFRWKQTGPFQFTGVVKSYLVSLKQLNDNDVGCCFHNLDGFDDDDASLALLDFLNVGINCFDVVNVFGDGVTNVKYTKSTVICGNAI